MARRRYSFYSTAAFALGTLALCTSPSAIVPGVEALSVTPGYLTAFKVGGQVLGDPYGTFDTPQKCLDACATLAECNALSYCSSDGGCGPAGGRPKGTCVLKRVDDAFNPLVEYETTDWLSATINKAGTANPSPPAPQQQAQPPPPPSYAPPPPPSQSKTVVVVAGGGGRLSPPPPPPPPPHAAGGGGGAVGCCANPTSVCCRLGKRKLMTV